jgi:hypothetical protein
MAFKTCPLYLWYNSFLCERKGVCGMALDIQSVRDQLTSLLLTDKDAITNKKPPQEIRRIEQQIEKIEMLIADRKKVMNQNQSRN